MGGAEGTLSKEKGGRQKRGGEGSKLKDEMPGGFSAGFHEPLCDSEKGLLLESCMPGLPMALHCHHPDVR